MIPGHQFVGGDSEKALDLAGVQINGQETIRPGNGDEIGQEASGDGHTRLVLLIGATIGVIGHNGCDAPGAVSAQSINGDEEFHNHVIDRLAKGLNQKHIFAADALFQAHEYILV